VSGRCRVGLAHWSLALGVCYVWVTGGCGARSTLDTGELSQAEPNQPPGRPDDMPPMATGGTPAMPRGGSPAMAGRSPAMPSGGTASAGTASAGTASGGATMCDSIEVPIDELRPSVTLLVDQSGSMREGYPDRDSPDTRWSLVRQALLDPNSGVVPSLQHSIQFGLVFYTSHNGYSSGTCPILSTVQNATNNYAAISRLYDKSSPDDDTPTGAALQQVVRNIVAAGRRSTEVLLLVTDGDPDTCEQPDPQNGQAEAVAGAQAVYAAGIDFYVLGVSSDISGDKLQQMANAGQGKPLDAIWGVDPEAAEPFQASASVGGLTNQLRNILDRVPLCQIELDRPVEWAELGDGEVLLDGKVLELGSLDGFRLKDPLHLEIMGEACKTLRASGKQLSVRISCD
jgi:hypothetical protein